MFHTQVGPNVQTVDSGLRKFFNNIYQNVGYALLLIGCTSFFVAHFTPIQYLLFKTPLFFVALIAPIGLSLYLQTSVHKISVSRAQTLYWMIVGSYAVMLSSIFSIFTPYSIFSAFITAGAIFCSASYYGTRTDTDLSQFNSMLRVGMWGLLGAMLVNLLIGSGMLQTLISMSAVLIFTVMIAYESQTLSNLYYVRQSEDSLEKIAILGSLQLFLSFITIFMHLLRLMGTRRE